MQPDYKFRRRNFLTGAIYTLSSLIFGTLAASVGGYLFGTPRRAAQNSWCDAGDISELRTGSPEQITFERSRTDAWKVEREKASAWLVLKNDGSLTAFSPLCTHLGCSYHWDNEKHRFACPCHGSEFSKTGAVITGPASRPLDRYTVKIEGTRLWLGPIQSRQQS